MPGDMGQSQRVTRGGVPALPRWTVPRPRLTETILDAAAVRAVVVASPSGYGMTTLAAQIAQATRGPVAWVDGALADVGRDGVRTLLHEGEPSLIVLDGVEPRRASHLTLIDEALATPQATKVLITTHDATWQPSLSASQILRIDARALSFTDDEGARLALALRPEIDADELARLVRLAGGWPLAVVRAIQQTRFGSAAREAEWLESDGCAELMLPWLNSLPAAARALLEATSVLDRLTPALCDAITGRGDSAETLTMLSADHAFLWESSEPRSSMLWVERHGLLTLALRRGQRGMDLTAAHAAAAQWFESTPYVDRRIQHLLAAGRSDEAARTLLEFEDALLEGGAADRVVRWYAEMPEQALGSRPGRILRVGWGRALSGDRAGAQLAASQLAAVVLPTGAQGGLEDGALPWRAELSLLRAYVAAMAGDTREMAEQSLLAMELFGGASDRNSHLMAPLLHIRARLWSGDSAGAARELQVLSGLPFEAEVLRESVATGLRSLVATGDGRVSDGLVLAQSVADWHASQGFPLIHHSALTGSLAYAYAEVEAARVKPGMTLLREIIQAARDRQMTGEAAFASFLLAGAAHAAGDSRTALRVIADARGLLAVSAPASGLVRLLSQVEAEVRLCAGDVVRAERLISSMPPTEERAFLHAKLNLSRNMTISERQLSAIAPATPRAQARLQLLLAQASLRRSLHLAEAHLLRAADIAYDNGMELLLACADEALLRTAEAAARRSGHDALMGYVATARALNGSGSPSPVGAIGTSRALSPGEVELLSLLDGRETNGQIAEILGVSVNTVKTRIARLYRKMGVQSRNELLKVARSRGLLKD